MEPTWQNQPKQRIPSWVISMMFHAAALILLALLLRSVERGFHNEPLIHVEIVVLKPSLPDGGSQAAQVPAGAAAGGAKHAAQSAFASLQQFPQVDLAGALPSLVPEAQAAFSAEGLLVGAGDLTKGVQRTGFESQPINVHGDPALAGPPEWTPSGSPAELKMFGLPGQGHSFVFVIDHSNSMGRGMRYVLQAAKAELTAALNTLHDNHRFQIIFYNDRPEIFGGAKQGWSMATPEAKQQAQQFLRQITPSGSTQHDLALYAALRLRPEVIFLLTDAQDPVLSPLDLSILRRNAADRTTIHTIEFGLGPAPPDDNFLKQLARENGGLHRYVDVTQSLSGKTK